MMKQLTLKFFINSILIYLTNWQHISAQNPCELFLSDEKIFALEQAKNRDIAQILSIYKNIPDADSSKIVIFPETIRHKKLAESIRQKRLFVARDMNTNKIVSFAKIYLLDNSAELKEILTYEIRALHLEYELLSSGYYSIPKDKTLDHKEKLEFNPGLMIEPHNSRGLESPRCLRPRIKYVFNPETQTYIYYGGAYTIPTERGHGLNTKVQNFALRFIESQVLKNIRKNNSTSLFYLYGQVNANTTIKNSIRIFANYINIIRKELEKEQFSEIRIHSFRYRAYKPIFQLNEKGLLTQLPDYNPAVEQGRGVGNVLCHNFEEILLPPVEAETSLRQEINPFIFSLNVPPLGV